MIHRIQVALVVLIVFGSILEQTHGNVSEQFWKVFKNFIQSNCNCLPYQCCSKWGYCGLTNGYCGEGCQSGPCKSRPTNYQTSFGFTPETFQCVFSNIDSNIRNRRFQGLTKAMIQMKWKPINNVEAAIFLAHIYSETDGLSSLAEDCIKHGTCDNYQSSWCSIQPNPNRKYYGRGMLQLSYPCNYYEAGKALELDLLNNPDLVSQSDKVAAATAIWYYRSTGMNQLAQQGNFAGITRRLNKYQCSGKAGYAMQMTRIKTYQRVRKCFGLPETSVNITC